MTEFRFIRFKRPPVQHEPGMSAREKAKQEEREMKKRREFDENYEAAIKGEMKQLLGEKYGGIIRELLTSYADAVLPPEETASISECPVVKRHDFLEKDKPFIGVGYRWELKKRKKEKPNKPWNWTFVTGVFIDYPVEQATISAYLNDCREGPDQNLQLLVDYLKQATGIETSFETLGRGDDSSRPSPSSSQDCGH